MGSFDALKRLRRSLCQMLAIAGAMGLLRLVQTLCENGPLHGTVREELAIQVLLVIGSIAGARALFSSGLEVLRQHIITDGERIRLVGRHITLLSVALADIVEIHVRVRGNGWFFGLDQGIGIVLARPQYGSIGGVAVRMTPRLNHLVLKCHVLIAPWYDRPLEELGAAIAEAASRVRGVPVPVRTIGVLSPPPSLDASAVVVQPGVVCVGCGYDLRTLPSTGRCPECGTAIRRSLMGRSIETADPVWVSALKRGCGILVWATLLWCAAVQLGCGILIDHLLGNPFPTQNVNMFLVVLCAALVTLVLGAWGFTVREPGIVGRVGDPRSRRMVRYAFALPVPVLLAGFGHCLLRASAAIGFVGTVALLAALLLWYARRVLLRMGSNFWASFAAVTAVALALAGLELLFFVGTECLTLVTGTDPLSSFARRLGRALQPAPPASAPTPDEIRMTLTIGVVLQAALASASGAVFLAVRLGLRRSEGGQREKGVVSAPG